MAKAMLVVAAMWSVAPAAAWAKGKSKAHHASPKVEGVANLNGASAQQLDLLPGVSPKTAAGIVAYRAQHPFTRTEEVVRVKGFGKKRFEKVKGFLSVSGPTTLHAVQKLKAAKKLKAAQARTRTVPAA
jgi:competence protein ComEA